MSVCPAIHMVHIVSHWLIFLEILYWGFLIKYIKKIKFGSNWTKTLHVWSSTKSVIHNRHTLFSVRYVLIPNRARQAAIVTMSCLRKPKQFSREPGQDVRNDITEQECYFLRDSILIFFSCWWGSGYVVTLSFAVHLQIFWKLCFLQPATYVTAMKYWCVNSPYKAVRYSLHTVDVT
jgi:hypothetical protein